MIVNTPLRVLIAGIAVVAMLVCCVAVTSVPATLILLRPFGALMVNVLPLRLAFSATLSCPVTPTPLLSVMLNVGGISTVINECATLLVFPCASTNCTVISRTGVTEGVVAVLL